MINVHHSTVYMCMGIILIPEHMNMRMGGRPDGQTAHLQHDRHGLHGRCRRLCAGDLHSASASVRESVDSVSVSVSINVR